MAITTSLSFLYIGYLALKGVLTIGEFTMVISASTLLMNSINSIISEGIELRKKCTYADNFVAYMMSKADYPVDKSGEALECNNYEIEFSHVYFAYPKDVQSCGAVIQNVLLASHALGVESCWIGEILINSDKVLDALELDGHRYELMAVITLGYSKLNTSRVIKKDRENFILRSF